jgi:hypothetical protein
VINRSADRGAVPPQANVARRGVRAATGRTIVAQDSADESTDGEGFLRDMAAQSARAHTFDRRMRWFWLRRSLRDSSPAPEDVGDVGDAADSVDLRGHVAPLTGEPAAAPAAPAAPGAATGQVPRQRG